MNFFLKSIRDSRQTLGLCACLFFALSFNGFTNIYAGVMYPLPSKQQELRFQQLLKNLRCLVCQNQDLADSNASLAKDLRDEVYMMVKADKSETEIIDYLSQRYGDFILFSPPLKSLTYALWFGPIVFLAAGLLILWLTCLRRKRKVLIHD